MAQIRRIVLDTLKPHDPDIISLSSQLGDLNGVTAVNISIVEIDRRVENAKVTIIGDDIRYEAVLAVIQDLGGAVHSIDEVVSGATLVDPAPTMQD